MTAVLTRDRAIVVLAVAMDRFSQAFAAKAGQVHKPVPGLWYARHKRVVLVIVLLILIWILGRFSPLLLNYPAEQAITTGAFWDNLVNYLNVNYFDSFEAVKVFFLHWFLLPTKKILLGIPWPWTIAMLALLWWPAGGWRLALICAVMSGLIVITGLVIAFIAIIADRLIKAGARQAHIRFGLEY